MIDCLIPCDPNNTTEKIDEHLWESKRQPLLESGHTTIQCIQDVIYMNNIAQNRRKKRITSGSLIINKLKLTFNLDQDGNPIDMSSYHIQQSNNLVEEMMLIANYLSAKYLLFNVYGAAFLRYVYVIVYYVMYFNIRFDMLVSIYVITALCSIYYCISTLSCTHPHNSS